MSDFKPGDKVKYYPYGKNREHEITVVRSEPWDTASGIRQVFIEGRALGVDVEKLEKIESVD